jgi:hypothetical protein
MGLQQKAWLNDARGEYKGTIGAESEMKLVDDGKGLSP